MSLAWRVRQDPKGHFPEALHIALVERMSEGIPTGTQGVFLGDGEFDGTALQETLTEVGWFYACRYLSVFLLLVDNFFLRAFII
jgi:hypothetical protein